MPQAIAAFIITAVSATGVAAALITAVVTIAFTIGVNALIQSLFGPGRPRPSDGQQTVRAAVGSRRRHYGIVHTGGQLSFLDSVNGTLGQAVTLGTGTESGEIIEHRINDKPVTLDGSGTVTEASYHGAIHIHTRHGEADQAAIAELTAKFPAWTADHRQRGCAHAAIIADPVDQEQFSEVFNGQMPQYSQVRKAVKIYDPRKDSTAVIFDDGEGFTVNGTGPQRLDDRGTWDWSDNGPLVIADFFAHEDGYGGGFDNVNWTNIAIEAGHADEDVTARGGETIARWRLWASYGLATDERRRVLSDMLAAIDGFCWQDADAKFNLMCGRFEEPDLVIPEDHVLGITASLGPKAREQVSAVKVLYTEAATGYREQESATISDPARPEDPNTAPQTVELFYAPHHNQASRVGKLVFARLGDRWHVSAIFNLFGLNLIGRRFCRFRFGALDIDHRFAIDNLKLRLFEQRVEATLSEVRPEDWDYDAATEEGEPPISGASGGGPVTIAEPTGLVLNAVPLAFGQSNGVAIAAEWIAERPGLLWDVRYRPTAGGDWVMMVVDQAARTARSGPVDSGVEYEAQIRARTLLGRVSDWSASETITPTAAASVPAPSSIAAEGGSGAATVRIGMPATAVDHVELYRATSVEFGTAVQVGADIVAGPGVVVIVDDSGLSAGTFQYWARAFDGGSGQSALAGPAPAIVS